MYYELNHAVGLHTLIVTGFRITVTIVTWKSRHRGESHKMIQNKILKKKIFILEFFVLWSNVAITQVQCNA